MSFYNYDEFLKIINYIENNFLCPFCKGDYLLSISPFDLVFVCPKCDKISDLTSIKNFRR